MTYRLLHWVYLDAKRLALAPKGLARGKPSGFADWCRRALEAELKAPTALRSVDLREYPAGKILLSWDLFGRCAEAARARGLTFRRWCTHALSAQVCK